ncbi:MULTISPECIES: Txe/YoeB family addiction module toxin [unclassified Streptomyces]|uniref:Txe/YoeB family addiction module toxin n=1 Tax=unclassified Streptomyces TaxID=2593676 RepID=UPI001906FE09|nr:MULTISPECIES: Txe/YoeB family addiction module toxin [unclassified Streptomyces]MCU4748019.1 Txe/YoeB family addiction module toxin [Streptomyces sp. G-5]QQN78630.1 Txe/YoeB family addiction module toxin [Streptomyces sp. XC 2026]
MRNVDLDPAAWDDFLFWLASDRKTARRITRLIAEVQRTPFEGIGKPEPLKGDLTGYWSRRINDEHRLVCRTGDKEMKIIKARYHY